MAARRQQERCVWQRCSEVRRRPIIVVFIPRQNKSRDADLGDSVCRRIYKTIKQMAQRDGIALGRLQERFGIPFGRELLKTTKVIEDICKIRAASPGCRQSRITHARYDATPWRRAAHQHSHYRSRPQRVAAKIIIVELQMVDQSHPVVGQNVGWVARNIMRLGT